MWKIIDNTNGKLEVNELGEIRSSLRGEPRILKTQITRKGYHKVRVTIERRKFSLTVHREVAKAFVPNPDNFPQVNHKDGNKDNNSASNLEWCTNIQNAHHAIQRGLWNSLFEASRLRNEAAKKPIIAYKLKGAPCTRYYHSVSDAERAFDSRHICEVLKGRRKHVKGWAFEYAHREEVV